MTDPLPRRIAWFAPRKWKPTHWLAAFIIFPPLYLLLVISAEQSAINAPENSWLRSVVNIIRAPLEPLRRPFRRTATRNIAEMFPDCEVCGEPAVVHIWEFVYIWEGAIVSDRKGGQCRPFCDRHHHEYLDGPADALKPSVPLPPGFD